MLYPHQYTQVNTQTWLIFINRRVNHFNAVYITRGSLASFWIVCSIYFCVHSFVFITINKHAGPHTPSLINSHLEISAIWHIAIFWHGILGCRHPCYSYSINIISLEHRGQNIINRLYAVNISPSKLPNTLLLHVKHYLPITANALSQYNALHPLHILGSLGTIKHSVHV
jgi:hypothetical protein